MSLTISGLMAPEFSVQKNNQLNKHNISQKNLRNNFEFPSGNFYNLVSFTGGKSMDLTATKTQLDKLGQYPVDIKEAVNETLAKGNPVNKTLIDIHKDKYSLLSICDNLSDVKELYPEFTDVLSDNEIDYNKGSFIDKVKNGEIKGFDKDKDVSLQLLQLYWGEGFSIPSLSETSSSSVTSIYNALKKLNIPTVDKTYGIYLKLSDKDYNQRYTQTISDRMKSIEHKGITGDRTYTKRTPMSEEQKIRISEGLKNFYSNNPERLSEMSELRTIFFEEHPEEKEKFSQVLLRAWNYNEAKPIRKSMSRFLKKNDINNDEAIDLFLNNKNLKDFWKKNPWAKEKWSICMKKSWSKQEELSKLGLIYEPLYVGNMMPEGLRKDIGIILKNKYGKDIINSNSHFFILDPKESSLRKDIDNNTTLTESLSKAEFDILNSDEELNSRLFYSMFLGVYSTCKNDKQYNKFIRNNLHLINDNFVTLHGILSIYIDTIKFAVENNDINKAKQIEKEMNRMYNLMKNMDNKEMADFMKITAASQLDIDFIAES